MKNLKTTVASVLIMSALFSTSAFANKALDAKVKAAADLTISQTQAALDILEKNGDKDEVLKLMGEVRQTQKDFRYEQTERLRQKAGDKLRVSREELEKGDKAAATNNLRAALDYYKEMMTIYTAAH